MPTAHDLATNFVSSAQPILENQIITLEQTEILKAQHNFLFIILAITLITLNVLLFLIWAELRKLNSRSG